MTANSTKVNLEALNTESVIKPMTMVGGINRSPILTSSPCSNIFLQDKWYYAPEEVAEFNTNHPVASSIIYAIQEELTSLPEPVQKLSTTNYSWDEISKGNSGIEMWNLYVEEMTASMGYACHTELSISCFCCAI